MYASCGYRATQGQLECCCVHGEEIEQRWSWELTTWSSHFLFHEHVGAHSDTDDRWSAAVPLLSYKHHINDDSDHNVISTFYSLTPVSGSTAVSRSSPLTRETAPSPPYTDRSRGCREEPVCTNPISIVFDTKRFNSRKLDNPKVQADMNHFPFKVISHWREVER